MDSKLKQRLRNLHFSLVDRCYNEKKLQRNPSYIGCVVSEDFYEFENFCENIQKVSNFEVWVSEKDWQLDKDLFTNSRIYSVDTCCFLPKKLNIVFQTGGQQKHTGLPNGVIKGKARVGVSYIAQCIGEKGSNRHLGTYYTVEEAFNAYSLAKQRLVARLTIDYFHLLDDKTIDKLLEYKPSYDYK